MTREKRFTLIGLTLLASSFCASLVQIAWSASTDSLGGGAKVTIRLAHWQLEDGPRKAFDKIAAEYMKLHPGVRVEQLAIPERIFPNWFITQLVGGTAPDLIEIAGANSERVARYFTPLADIAAKPNPYNQGTELESVPLRDTFFDGMEGGLYGDLYEYYGVPISGSTIRMFYNVDLLKEMTGSEVLPRTYDELAALCRKAAAHPGKAPIIPIASSQYNGPLLMARLFSSQTQKLVERLTPPGLLGDDPIRRGIQYVEGEWSVEDPDVRSGFALMREVAQWMQPGFMQLQRDDAMFLFVQRRALMICTGSWDATSIRQQAPFRVAVGNIPFPSAADAKYGSHTLGPLSEAGINAGVSFGLVRQSPHADMAKDFLLFLASKRTNQLWTDISGWIPSIIHTTASPETVPFLPGADGALPGVYPHIASGFINVYRAYLTNLHRLLGTDGSTRAMISALRPQYSKAVRKDMERYRQTTLDIVQQNDTQLAALAWISSRKPDDAAATARFEGFMESTALNQRKHNQIRLSFEKSDSF